MRLGEIYNICLDVYGRVSEDYTVLKKVCENDIKRLFDTSILLEKKDDIDHMLNNIIHTFETLKDIDVLNTVILGKRDLSQYLSNGILLVKDKSEYINNIERIFNLISELIYKTKSIVDLCKYMGIGENGLGIDIKMPQTEDITDFKKYINDLEFVFTKCPFFQSDEEEWKLKSVDIGSIWLVLVVSGVAVATGSMLLNNIAAFIDKCYIIKSHKLTCKMQSDLIENSVIAENEKRQILENVKKIYKLSVDKEIKELEELTKVKIKDNDDRSRIDQCFDRLENLLDKGLQIYASVDSPKEVKAVFAPIEMHYLSQKKNIAKIEEKMDEQ